MSQRTDKIGGLLVELLAGFIAREAGRSTLITPTRADIGRDGKRATIYVSVFPTEEAKHAIAFLERNRGEFRAYIKDHSRLGILPRIEFMFDAGEQNRQRLDEISRQL